MPGKPGKQVSRYFFLIGYPEQNIGDQDKDIGRRGDPFGQFGPDLQQADRKQAEENDRHQDGHILKLKPKDPGWFFQYFKGVHYSTTIRLLPPIREKISFL